MLSGGNTRYIGVKIVGDILNATTMCPVRTLKLHFRAHFECFQHVIPGHLVSGITMFSACSHQVLRPLPPVFPTMSVCRIATLLTLSRRLQYYHSLSLCLRARLINL